jgi:hypothetical protein
MRYTCELSNLLAQAIVLVTNQIPSGRQMTMSVRESFWHMTIAKPILQTFKPLPAAGVDVAKAIATTGYKALQGRFHGCELPQTFKINAISDFPMAYVPCRFPR